MNRLSGRIPVAVAGATGSVGQRFVALLDEHPWFDLVALTASERSAGQRYRDVVRWMQSTPLPPRHADRELRPTVPAEVGEARIVFSALDAAAAGPAEEAFARDGRLVVSNAKSHRLRPDVPLLVPEVNADHLELLNAQPFGAGGILTNPNCSTIGLVLALKPLVDAFGVEAVHVVTLQALSGAGIPGVSGMQVVDNVIPWIAGEEEKIETETLKILGHLRDGTIESASVAISAQCNRVPVLDGHTECVSVKLRERASEADLRRAWSEFSGEPQALGLPSAPAEPVQYLDAPDAPQPRLHRDRGRGMAATVGRLRPCGILDWKFVTLSHNTLRGAAGGALLVGELAVEKGCLRRAAPETRSGG